MRTFSGSGEVWDLAGRLYEENAAHLLRIATRNAQNTADAEEAISEAMVSFLRAYRPETGAPPLAWFVLALKRQCWRQWRDAHLDKYVGQEVERGSESPGAVIEALPARGSDPRKRIEEKDEARMRLAKLKPNERTAVGAHAAGYSYKEIAASKGWTYTKVCRCIKEGRIALASA